MLTFPSGREALKTGAGATPWGWTGKHDLGGELRSVRSRRGGRRHHRGASRTLVGLLVLGPSCAVLTRRWSRTAISGTVELGLAVLLGVPDGIWGTATHLTFIAAVLAVAVVSASGAFVVERFAFRR